jgi:hypothetical protein
MSLYVSPCFSSLLGFISNLPQLAWDKRLCCCCCCCCWAFFFEPLQSLKPWTVKWIHLIMNSQDHDWLRVELGVLILQKIVKYKLQWRWSGRRVPAVLLSNRSSTQLTFLLAQNLSRVVLRESLCSITNCSTDPETAIPWECHFMLDYL